jgi:hypothetical protein
LQRRQADESYARDSVALVTAVAHDSRPEFDAALPRLAPNFADPNSLYNRLRQQILEDQASMDMRNAALARVEGRIDDMNRHLLNGRNADHELKSRFNDNGCQQRHIVLFERSIAEQGKQKGWSEEQIRQAQEDGLMAVQKNGFDTGSIVGAALELGIAFNPSSTRLTDPDTNSEAQNVLDAIRINAMLMSRDRMQRLRELDSKITNERDIRSRRLLEEEYNETSRELTRLMGRNEGVPSEANEGDQIRISATDATQIVSNHIQAVIAIHSGRLDEVVLSRRRTEG